jgi:hypothetical protein
VRSLCSYKVDRDVTLERCEALHAAEAVRQRVQTADPNTRLRWSEWVLTATGLEDVFAESVQWETPVLGLHDYVVRPLFLLSRPGRSGGSTRPGLRSWTFGSTESSMPRTWKT